MTVKRIIYTRADGGLTVVQPCDPARLVGESEADFVRRIADRLVPAGVPYRIIDASDLPSRRWRAAWADAGSGSVAVPLARARLVRRRELLARRLGVLAALGEQIEAALDEGDTMLAVARRAKRRRVRDLTAESLDAELAAIPDLATLDTYTPADLA